jgi:hypothetical protein
MKFNKKMLVRLSANLKVIELYLLNIVLIIFLTVCLWALPQSADILVKASEATEVYTRSYLMCALYFYVFITWYTSRAVAWQSRINDKSYFSSWMMLHLPRLMGFYIYSIFVLSYLNTPLFLDGIITLWVFLLCLAFDFFLFLFLEKLLKWKGPVTSRMISFYKFIFWFNLLLIFLCALLPYKWSLLGFVMLSQGMFVFLVVNRQDVFNNTPAKPAPGWIAFITRLLHIGNTEILLFTLLQIVYMFGLVVYMSAVFWLDFASRAGTLTILFCALGVIGGAVNLLKALSFLYRINLTLILLAVLFLLGFRSEPHRVHLEDTARNAAALPFENRQAFREYLNNWLNHHAEELKRDSIVPMIFVHADGGASRSGYWVASVLSKLEDEAGFSNNLFCLSGASGGSLGNAAFFSLLYSRSHGRNAGAAPGSTLTREVADVNFLQQAQSFLSADFLSYTLARMLGPGAITNLIYPIIPDRARALEVALENGPEESGTLNDWFKTGFSKLIAAHNDPGYQLPVLCMNVTRMQDGNPALISNIKIDSSISKARLDILSQIKAGKDINLSTATVLGARFPYLSPAGLIVQKNVDPADSTATLNQYHYYVDGGYFDNSGAGIVQELIQNIELIKNDADHVDHKYGSFRKQDLNKLRYVVIHIKNSAPRADGFTKIHPFKNDFFAPIVTIAGTYGSQTEVNDSRLRDYVYSLNKNDTTFTATGLNEYFDVNLYTNDPKEHYPMNWVISKSVLAKMNTRLNRQDTLRKLISALKTYYIAHPNR